MRKDASTGRKKILLTSKIWSLQWKEITSHGGVLWGFCRVPLFPPVLITNSLISSSFFPQFCSEGCGCRQEASEISHPDFSHMGAGWDVFCWDTVQLSQGSNVFSIIHRKLKNRKKSDNIKICDSSDTLTNANRYRKKRNKFLVVSQSAIYLHFLWPRVTFKHALFNIQNTGTCTHTVTAATATRGRRQMWSVWYSAITFLHLSTHESPDLKRIGKSPN